MFFSLYAQHIKKTRGHILSPISHKTLQYVSFTYTHSYTGIQTESVHVILGVPTLRYSKLFFLGKLVGILKTSHLTDRQSTNEEGSELESGREGGLIERKTSGAERNFSASFRKGRHF